MRCIRMARYAFGMHKTVRANSRASQTLFPVARRGAHTLLQHTTHRHAYTHTTLRLSSVSTPNHPYMYKCMYVCILPDRCITPKCVGVQTPHNAAELFRLPARELLLCRPLPEHSNHPPKTAIFFFFPIKNISCAGHPVQVHTFLDSFIFKDIKVQN